MPQHFSNSISGHPRAKLRRIHIAWQNYFSNSNMSDDHDSSSSDDSDVPELVPRDEHDNVIPDEEREFEDEDRYVDSLNPATDLFSKKTFRTAEECIDHCRLRNFAFS